MGRAIRTIGKRITIAMTLATQCPHCHTTFRVANDQLKLRAGLVRCGACKEIFNGIEHLIGSNPAPVKKTAKAISPPVVSIDAITIPGNPANDTSITATPIPSDVIDMGEQKAKSIAALSAAIAPEEAAAASTIPEPPAQQQLVTSDRPVSVIQDKADNPLQRMTLIEFSNTEDAAGGQGPQPIILEHAPDPLDQAIEDLQRKPLRRKKKKASAEKNVAASPEDQPIESEPEIEEPGFVTRGRRQQKLSRVLRILMGIGSFLLLLGLLAQAAYSFRDQIAARLPQSKTILAEACTFVGCRVGLPAQIETVAIESSELQAVPGHKDTFVLTTLLRNYSATQQTWPTLELTLNDTNDKALARRIFLPRDYLSSAQDTAKGFSPASEQSVKLFFELSQLKASGYHVGLFYP
jgi:predicted Zn finger-like uncharacterized protein